MSVVPVESIMSRTSRGYLIAISGVIFWSSTAIFIRFLTVDYGLPPLVLAFWRDLIVCLTLGFAFALFNRSRLRLKRENLRFLVFYGLVLSVFNSLWTVSVALNGAAVATVLAYSSPVYTALAGWRMFGEPLTRAKILAVTLSIAGCVLVSGAYDRTAWQVNPAGINVGLLAGMAFAGYSLLGKASSQRGINPWTALFYSFGIAALFLLVYNLAPAWLAPQSTQAGLFWLGKHWLGWAVLIILAAGPTIGGYGLFTVSLTYLSASVASLIGTLEPAMTAIQAYLFLGERLTVLQLLGSFLIIIGVVILRVNESRLSFQLEDSNKVLPPTEIV